MRDRRLAMSEVPDYEIVIQGEATLQNQMFNRADMSFWEFSVSDVTPPEGCKIDFFNGEPVFIDQDGVEVYHGELRRCV